MLCKRIIPCLDCKDGRVVKGVQFQGLLDAGDPIELALTYEKQGADEIVLLDISATPEGRKTKTDLIEKIRLKLKIPLTVGGGIQTIEDARRLLQAGADKVGINTAAVKKPGLINQMAETFGRQCTVLALDASKTQSNTWQVVIRSGKERTGLDVFDWAKEVVFRGAGEILLTSWDQDGKQEGYDLDLIEKMTEKVKVPIIASGGAGKEQHFFEALEKGADAVLAASLFHQNVLSIKQLKKTLRDQGVEVRL